MAGGGRGGLTDRSARPAASGRLAQLLGTALDGSISAEQQRPLAEHLSLEFLVVVAPGSCLPKIAGEPFEVLPLGGTGGDSCRLLVLVGRRGLGCAATAHNGGGGLGGLLLQNISGCVT